MLRASFLVLLLICVCAPAMARNGRVPADTAASACQDIVDKVAENSLPADAASRNPKLVVRNKYAPAATAPAAPAATSRGGGDDGDASAPALPRPRAPKWHSFLPGMFR